jgi:anti-sigma factor RsiW
MNKQAIEENELHEYVDGRVEASRRAEIDAQLAMDPDAARRVGQFLRERQLLAITFDDVLDEPIPAALTARARKSVHAPRWLIAAAVSCVVVGSIAGWFVRGLVDDRATVAMAPGKPSFYRQAALAHSVYSPEVRHPVEVGADQQDHLVKWLSKRLGAPLNVPNLAGQGYQLVGGRLLPAATGAGAQFMFEDAKGIRLTLYISGDKNGASGNTAFRFAQENKVSVFYWVDGPFGYALSGEVEREKLLTIANVVYKQLNP